MEMPNGQEMADREETFDLNTFHVCLAFPAHLSHSLLSQPTICTLWDCLGDYPESTVGT